MATKINPNYYGAENTFVTVSGSSSVKRCANNVGQLMTNNIYTGGSFDTTASPWGIGESSVSSDFFFIASKGAEWSIVDYNNPKKNNPIWFYWNTGSIEGGDDTSDLDGSSASSGYYSRAMYKNRMSPNATISNAEIHSTLTIDNTDRIDLPGSANQYPITYADYQNLRLVIGDVWVKPEGSSSITRTSMSAIKDGTVTVDKLVRFNFSIYDTSENNTAMELSIGGTEMDIPETFKTCYYESEEKWVRPWHRISSVGYWYRSYYDQSVGFQVFNTDTGVAYTSAWEELSASDNAIGRPGSNGWGHMSSKEQEFDDVSYHWTWGITHWNNDQFVINQIENGDTFTSETLRNFAFMEFDNEPDDKNEACINAILHEVAFLGFPIVTSLSDVAELIGSDKVYLPIFDEHLITTGEFANGTAAAALPNAVWRDVFGADMPDYDPNYDPEPGPEPGPEDDEDSGNLINRGLYTNKFDNPAYTIWALYGTSLSNNGLDAIMAAINNLYITDPDGNSKWELQFKGSNPSDYIVGLFAYPLHFATSTNSYVFTLGPVPFDTINVYKYADNGYFTFGDIDLGYNSRDVKWFKDFRDFPPYTTAELYVPFCGTTDIDLTFFIGHTMTIDMYYDIYTGSCSAAVYRDNKTLYKVMNGQIGVQLPLTSVRAGDYQNNIHALENALKQNDIRLATSALALGASAATAIATGGTSLIAGAGAIGGISSFINTLNAREEIEYKLDHTQPAVAQTGAAETQNGYRVGGNRAKLLIKRTKMLKDYKQSTYSRTIGHACCINDTIGNRSGLIVCSGVDTSGIPATVEEINAIKQALSSGVYV